MADTAAQCPVRPGQPCMLCQPGGPDHCGLVYLVMTDPDLREELARRIRAAADGDEDDEAG